MAPRAVRADGSFCHQNRSGQTSSLKREPPVNTVLRRGTAADLVRKKKRLTLLTNAFVLEMTF